MPDLPVRPVSPDQKLLAAVVRRLDDQNNLLTRILDRLPESPAQGDGQTVELREPAQPEVQQAPVEKLAPARRPRKTAPKGATPSKEKP